MPSHHLILCRPLLHLHSIFSSIRVFSNESASGGQSIGVSASVLPVNIQGWFSLELTELISLQSKGLSSVFSSTTVQKYQFFGTQSSLWPNSHIRPGKTIALTVLGCAKLNRPGFWSVTQHFQTSVSSAFMGEWRVMKKASYGGSQPLPSVFGLGHHPPRRLKVWARHWWVLRTFSSSKGHACKVCHIWFRWWISGHSAASHQIHGLDPNCLRKEQR